MALIGSREACERLGISRSSLNYWMLTGRIQPAQTIPGPNARVATHLWDLDVVEQLASERAAS